MLSMILFAAFVADVPVKTEAPLKFYPSYAEVQDSSPGKTVPLKPVKIRKPGRFWMFVESPRRMEFTLRREADAGSVLDKKVAPMQFNFIQVECAGQHRRRWPAPGEKDFTFKWDSPHPGFYTLDFDPGKACSLVPVSANVPFALETDKGFEHLAQGKGWKVHNRPLKELDEAASKVKLEKPVNILYLGDSLSDYDRGSNHVNTVAEYLAKHNPGKVQCWNFAKGGDCIRYIIQRMDGKGKGDWKSRYDDLWNRKYDWAFILLGHNDTKTNLKNDFKEPFTPRAQQHEMYDELIRRLRARGIGRIVLLSSTSSNFDVCNHWVTSRLERAKAAGQGISLFGQPEQMEAFNKALREIAARNNVEYADLYDKMKARGDKPFMLRFTDGVHLSKKGYDFVALETLRYLAKNPAPEITMKKTAAPPVRVQAAKCAEKPPVQKFPEGDVIRNGSFEVRGQESAWTLPKGWRISRGEGMNGGGGLVFECSEKLEQPAKVEQIADIVSGRIYDFEAWVDGAIDCAKGAQVDIQFLDADGKVVDGVYSGTRANNKGWGRLSVRTKRLSAKVRKVRIRPSVPAGAKGRVSFDDISFKPHRVMPVTALCSSHYRNEAGIDDGVVTFFAGIDLADTGCSKDEVDVFFVYENPDGKIIRRKAEYFNGIDASIGIWPAAFKEGPQEISAEIVAKDGRTLGCRKLTFSRIRRRPRRNVAIDRYKRVTVAGKPFFPVGIYAGTANSNMVERLGRSPFNTLMAYHGLNRQMLDWCHENDLMANVHAGDYQTSEKDIAKKVSDLKNHPAVLAWLVNDEKPVSAMAQLKARYRTVLDNDDGHPTWAVLYQVDQIREYIGTCDVIGSDPYPVPHESLSWVRKSTEKARKGTFGALSLWQTSQIFDWAAYKTKAMPGTDVSKYRAPTLAEMKAMAWLEIAGGANAIFMYSYSPLEKMDWRDPFEKRWKDVCECASEIAKMSPVLLSVDDPPHIKNVSDQLSVRTWRTGATVHVLVCNASGKTLKTNLTLGEGRYENMRIVLGGGASMLKKNTLALDFAPEGYAFLSFDGDKPIDFEELKYNRPGSNAYIDAGTWAQPLVLDYDSDGDLDIVALSKSALTNAFILYENPTPKGVKCKMPVFRKGRTISTDVCNGHISSQLFDGKWIVTRPGGVMWDPLTRWGKFTNIRGVEFDPIQRDTKNEEKASYRVWRLVDFDGDGLEDVVIGLDSWTKYGVLKGNAYDSGGVWTNCLLQTRLYWSRCVSGRGKDAKYARTEELLLADGTSFQTDGDPCPMLEDFDLDGDIDIVCGDFTGGFWYFENTGTRTAPKYAARRRLTDASGAEVRCEVCMQVPLSVDWDGDGDADIVEGEEDGRIALIENLGTKNGVVRFSQPQYFRQEAEDLDFGCLSTPFGCDWDGDGDWDLICGNSAGRLAFIENLSGAGVYRPKWAEPVLMSAGGETINIRAGMNGSIQGPGEQSWGYTVPSVADWDGDGFLDVMMNDIWGHVRIYRNPGRKGTLDLEKPQPIEVEWKGANPELAWGWEKPKGKELLTQWRTRALMHDWNKDGLMDLIVLDQEGYLAWFERFKNPSGKLSLKHPRRVFLRDGRMVPLLWSNGAAGRSGRRQFCIADWTRDGKEDFLLNGGNVQLYRQIKKTDEGWTFSMGGGFGKRKLAGHPSCPTVVDFDNDGVPEAIVGTEDGRFFHHLNPYAFNWGK